MRGTDAIYLAPDQPATASSIWLHGLGADGHDFEPVVHELGLTARGIRVILPHAPERPVTINRDYVMRAWYDVRAPDFMRDQDAQSIRTSRYPTPHSVYPEEVQDIGRWLKEVLS